MSDISWTVSGGDGSVPSPSVSTEKHHFVTEKRISEGFNETQKTLVNDFNSMRKMLIKNGLMDDKK